MADYPIQNFHFQVDWGGTRIGFESVENLEVQSTYIEYREGSSKEYGTMKLPGRPIYGNIVLKRGVFPKDTEFFKWWRDTYFFMERGQPGSLYRRTVTIKVLNDAHEPILTWQLHNAFPVRFAVSDLHAQGNEVLIETLELTYEGLNLEA